MMKRKAKLTSDPKENILHVRSQWLVTVSLPLVLILSRPCYAEGRHRTGQFGNTLSTLVLQDRERRLNQEDETFQNSAMQEQELLSSLVGSGDYVVSSSDDPIDSVVAGVALTRIDHVSGSQPAAGAKFCPVGGELFSADVKFCPNHGVELKDYQP